MEDLGMVCVSCRYTWVAVFCCFSSGTQKETKYKRTIKKKKKRKRKKKELTLWPLTEDLVQVMQMIHATLLSDKLLLILNLCLSLRALSSVLSNVPNVKYLVHLAHQSQKLSLISPSKSQKIWDMATVPSQIWDSTDINAKHYLVYLIRFFSLLLSNASLALSSSTSLALSVCHSRHTLSPLRTCHRRSCHVER